MLSCPDKVAYLVTYCRGLPDDMCLDYCATTEVGLKKIASHLFDVYCCGEPQDVVIDWEKCEIRPTWDDPDYEGWPSVLYFFKVGVVE
jgi:hypothetical protein